MASLASSHLLPKNTLQSAVLEFDDKYTEAAPSIASSWRILTCDWFRMCSTLILSRLCSTLLTHLEKWVGDSRNIMFWPT